MPGKVLRSNRRDRTVMDEAAIRRLVAAYKAGACGPELAKRFGIPQTRMYQLLNEAGVRPERKFRWL